MSDFWEKNKGSITSGLKSAGKYGYQGTKFVAKSGYQVSKKHYNTSKNKREGVVDDEGVDDDTSRTTASIGQLHDPSMFPPPPLKPGQMQYASSGQVVTGDGSSPVVSTPQPVHTPPAPAPVYDLPPRAQPVVSGYNGQQPIQMQDISQLDQNYYGSQPDLGIQTPAPVSSQPYIRQAMAIPQNISQIQPQGAQQVPPEMAPQTVPQPGLPYRATTNFTQPSPRAVPGLPSRSATNFTQPQIEEMEDTPGPHYEVTPFSAESFDENKDKKKIIIPQADVSTFSPPPIRRDRGVGANPLITNSNGASSPTTHSPSGTPSIAPSLSRRSTQESFITANEIPAHESTGTPKPSIIGTYQEPTTEYMPPPMPHTNATQTLPPRTVSKPPTRSSIPLTTNIPAALPQRDNSTPTTPALSSRKLTQENLEPSVSENEIASDEPQHFGIAGTYKEPTTSFAPPPTPHRQFPAPLSRGSTSHSMSKQSVPTRSATSATFGVTSTPPAVPLSKRPSNISSSSTDNSEKPQVAVLGSYVEPFVNFAPIPPQRTSTATRIYLASSSPISVPLPGQVDQKDVATFLPPPHPFKQVSTANENDLETPEPKETQPLVSKKDITISSRFIKEDKPLSSFPPPPSAPGRFHLETPKSTESKPKGPPPVKAKPKLLNQMNFDINDSGSASAAQGTPKSGKKSGPPVVKPKPKSLSASSTYRNPVGDITRELNNMKLNYVEPEPFNTRTTESSLQKSKQPTPSTTDTMDDDDYNPFSIYKKDAVPAKEDRIHNRV